MASAGAPPASHRGGAGEPLLLLHGGGGTWRLWSRAIPILEREHDVLAVTLADHWGGPELPPEVEPSVDALADAVERDMDAAGWRTAHVAGGSLGGWLALELARRGRARTVVAIAPGGGWESGSLAYRVLAAQYTLIALTTPLLARRAERWTRSPLMRRLLLATHFHRPERVPAEDAAELIRGAAAMTRMREGLAAMKRYGGARGLDEIGCPVLLAFPEHDLVLPRRFYGRRLVEGIPHAEVVDLPDVGHAAMVDDPALVASVIAGFVRRHAGAREPALQRVAERG